MPIRALILAIPFAALVVAAGCSAPPGKTERDERDWQGAEVSNAPCDNPRVLRHVPQGYRDLFRAAFVRVDGERVAACWRPVYGKPGLAFFEFEDGDGAYFMLTDPATKGPNT